MEDSPLRQSEPELNVDISAIEGEAPPPPAPHAADLQGLSAAAAATAPYDEDDSTAPRSPVYATAINGTARSSSGTSKPRPSVIKTRRSSTGTAVATSESMRPSLAAMMASPTAAVRRRDSIKHPYPLTGSNQNGSEETAAGEEANGDAEATPMTHLTATLYRPTPHGRRHPSTTSVLSCSPAPAPPADTAAAASAPTQTSQVNTTISASPAQPDTPAAPVPTTQEDVKRYVYAIVTQHSSMLAAWETRLSIAEVYRDKPLRTGGRPAPARPQDRGFLERIAPSLVSYMQQLDDTQSLLLQSSVEVPPTASGRPANVEAWRDYCDRFYNTVSDLAVEANLMRARVEKVLSAGQEEPIWSVRARSTSPRGGSARQPRSRTPDSAVNGRATPRGASRGASQPATPRQPPPPSAAGMRGRSSSARAERPAAVAAASAAAGENSVHLSPYAKRSAGGSVQRGSAAIRPGHVDAVSPSRGGTVSVGQLRLPQSIRSQSAPRRTDSPRSSAAAPPSTTSRLLALHPTTVAAPPERGLNAYDATTAYGRLTPTRRAASPVASHSPSRSLVMMTFPSDAEAGELHSAMASRRSLGVTSGRQNGAAPPQLRTYSSPRGAVSARPLSAAGGAGASAPALHPLRHRQLLEVIEHYEKNATTLQRGDLQRARACFSELYGKQKGLSQYCAWIDEVAIKALTKS